MSHPIAPPAVVPALLLLGGCANLAHPPDLDADDVYRRGASRAYLEDHYGTGHLIYCRDTVPADEFAAATLRGMVATGKPRASSYQVFVGRSPADGARTRDYVFYDDNHTVTYVARRRD